MPNATGPGVIDFVQASLAYHPVLSAVVVITFGYMGLSFGWACYVLFRK